MNSAAMQWKLSCDENTVSFKMIVQDTNLSSDIKTFKSKVRQSFSTKQVDFLRQYFELSGYEKLKDRSKFTPRSRLISNISFIFTDQKQISSFLFVI